MFTALVVVALGVLLCAAVYFGVRQIRMLQAEVVSLHRTQTLACTTAEIEDVVQGMLPYVIEEAAEGAVQSLSHCAAPSTNPVTGSQCSDPNGECSMANAHDKAEDKGIGQANGQSEGHVTEARPTSTRAATAVAEAKYAAVREAPPTSEK
jgi:hypothetical protein